MPTVKKPYNIAIKSSTTINAGERIKVTNLTTGGTITGTFGSSNEVILNPANSDLVWNDGDLLSIEVSGRLLGSTQTTLSKGGVRVTVTTAADTTSPAVDI